MMYSEIGEKSRMAAPDPPLPDGEGDGEREVVENERRMGRERDAERERGVPGSSRTLEVDVIRLSGT